ncbi:MAG: hypothetical protein HQL69_21585 [Magnetococcales bacterium]|nr:hypothetical protein [Magnetococcales bacterium]
MDSIIERLKEPSTWRGFAMLATAFGVSLEPDMVGAIVTAGTGVSGLIGIATKDKK